MDPSWFTVDAGAILAIFITAFCVYAALIVLVRLNGLRSFSKMSSHDFAITIAIGSIMGSTVIFKTSSLGDGLAALIALFLFQRIISTARRQFGSSPVDNRPLLLMRDGRILERNLARAQITREDLFSKLREANVLNMTEVRAVVLEATGDVSVLHGEREHFDAGLLDGVEGGVEDSVEDSAENRQIPG